MFKLRKCSRLINKYHLKNQIKKVKVCVCIDFEYLNASKNTLGLSSEEPTGALTLLIIVFFNEIS